MRRLFIALLAAALIGCSEDASQDADSDPEQPQPQKEPRLIVPADGITFTQPQRTTRELPGHNPDGGEAVLMTLDDVTRGQVMLSLAAADHPELVPARSVAAGDQVTFELDGAQYVLEVQALLNELVGEDEASFVLHAQTAWPKDASDAPQKSLTEQQKIEQLIQFIAELKDATFIRNGEEHTAADAAEHMRRKWQWQKDEIRTADDFIKLAATASSSSGKPYMIRFGDGREVPSADFLRQKLAEMQ